MATSKKSTKNKSALVDAINLAIKPFTGRHDAMERAVRKAVDNHWHWRKLAVQGDRETIEVWEVDGALSPFISINVRTGIAHDPQKRDENHKAFVKLERDRKLHFGPTAQPTVITDVDLENLTRLDMPSCVRRDALVALNLNGVYSQRRMANARIRCAAWWSNHRTTSVTLTELETKVLRNVVLNDYQPTNGSEPDSFKQTSGIWANCVDCGPEKIASTSIPGGVGSLVKKGLLVAEGRGKDATLSLTEEGWNAYVVIRKSRQVKL